DGHVTGVQTCALPISLAFVDYLRRMMKEDGVKARFVRGGSTRYLVEMLQEGLTDYILDGQTFDLDAVRSIANDPRHIATSPFTRSEERRVGKEWRYRW